MTLTEPAHSKLVELRDEEPEGNRLGVRIEILSDTGPDFTYDLSFATLTIDGDLAVEVKAIIDSEINPALDAHGGFVTFAGHDDDNTVYLTMGGGCHGCSMSRMTMMQGVQTMIREKIPAVTKVVDVTDHATGENPFYS